jgi:DNA-binding MarR family transcriptional regulator
VATVARNSPAERPYPGVTEPMAPALMRQNYEAAIERIFARLHEAGFTDVRPSHAPVIGYPGPHKTRPRELAARTGRSKQHINILLGELEAAGYLERRPDGTDQRGKIIHLTDRGMKLAAAVKEAVEHVEADWQRALGPRRFAALKRSLEDLRSAGAQLSGPTIS